MRDHIITRSKLLANHIIETKETVRDCAKEFDISKSTVHKDVSERLKEIDMQLYAQVKVILDYNLSVRHIRGGDATKEKYSHQ